MQHSSALPAADCQAPSRTLLINAADAAWQAAEMAHVLAAPGMLQLHQLQLLPASSPNPGGLRATHTLQRPKRSNSRSTVDSGMVAGRLPTYTLAMAGTAPLTRLRQQTAAQWATVRPNCTLVGRARKHVGKEAGCNS
jgi:hypothetical protein